MGAAPTRNCSGVLGYFRYYYYVLDLVQVEVLVLASTTREYK